MKKRPGRKYNRGRYWIQQRDAAFARAGDKCEVSGEPLSFVRHSCGMPGCVSPKHLKIVYKRAVDHVIPERAARKLFVSCDPHVEGNLLCVSSSTHARKTAVEWKIFGGDYIGFIAELKCIGYTQEMVDRALKALADSVKK
jgi:hypothetical protein